MLLYKLDSDKFQDASLSQKCTTFSVASRQTPQRSYNSGAVTLPIWAQAALKAAARQKAMAEVAQKPAGQQPKKAQPLVKFVIHIVLFYFLLIMPIMHILHIMQSEEACGADFLDPLK